MRKKFYKIKGSNEINGALIDTHIAVAEGVEANIIFDGAVIHNDEIYSCDMETSADTYAQLFPIHQLKGEDSWCKSICQDSQKSRCQSAKSKGKGIRKMAEKAWNRWKTKDYNIRKGEMMEDYPLQTAFGTPANICFVSDEGYAEPLRTALYSLLYNRDKMRLYDILILYENFSDEAKARTLRLAEDYDAADL